MKALPQPPAAYRIIVAENSHYQDKDAEYEVPGATTAEEAVVICRQIVDESLKEFATPGATAAEIYGLYTTFGDDPYIVGPPGNRVRFSAWEYALARAEDLAC